MKEDLLSSIWAHSRIELDIFPLISPKFIKLASHRLCLENSLAR